MYRYHKWFLILFCFSCTHSGTHVESNTRNGDLDSNTQDISRKADSLFTLNKYADAIPMFDTLINLRPRQGEYYFKRGYSRDMLSRKAVPDEGVPDYLKSIEFGYRKGACYLNLGLSYMFVNDSLAIHYFEKSLELKPNDPKLLSLLRTCQIDLQKTRNQIH